jgi:hypothetical protein
MSIKKKICAGQCERWQESATDINLKEGENKYTLH